MTTEKMSVVFSVAMAAIASLTEVTYPGWMFAAAYSLITVFTVKEEELIAIVKKRKSTKSSKTIPLSFFIPAFVVFSLLFVFLIMLPAILMEGWGGVFISSILLLIAIRINEKKKQQHLS